MTEKELKPTISTINKKCVAIVRFGPSGFITDGIKAGEYYQVTIDPDCCSPSGEYIRLGHNGGDEIQGWQRCDAISVVEILGEWDGQTPPTMSWHRIKG